MGKPVKHGACALGAFFTRGQFLPSGVVVACLYLCVCPSVRLCVNHLLVRAITRDPFKLGSPNLDQRCKRHCLGPLLFWGAIDIDIEGQIQLKIQNLPHFQFVRTISHYPFKLGSPNLDQMCQIAWLRFLLFGVAIALNLQSQIWFKKSNFLVSPLLQIHYHHITTREPWVPRLLHRPDCFIISTLCAYLYTQTVSRSRHFHSLNTDLGSRGYFGVYRRSCFNLD